MIDSSLRLAVDPGRLACLPAPLLLMRGTVLLAVGAALRPHLPRLLQAAGGVDLPAPAASWTHDLATRGRVEAPLDDGATMQAMLLAGDGDPQAPTCLALVSVEPPPAEEGTQRGWLDPKLAALLDSARFIAMGELVDALEHRLNQPRAALRNRMAVLEAVRERDPERGRALLAEAYGDMQTLLEVLAAFRAELHNRIDNADRLATASSSSLPGAPDGTGRIGAGQAHASGQDRAPLCTRMEDTTA